MNSLFTRMLAIGYWFETDFPCLFFLGEYKFPEE